MRSSFQTRGDRFERSFSEIGQALGLTRQRVEQIYNSAIDKLRRRGELEPSPPPTAKTPRLDLSWELAERLPPERAPTPSELYPDWTPENSMVVSGPISRANYPGRRFPTRQAARDYWLARTGRIYQDHTLPGRWIFRVKRGT